MSKFSLVTSKLVDGVLHFTGKASRDTTIFKIDPRGIGLGPATTPTVAGGVLTVASSHVNPLPESSTTDTVDSIVKTGQAAGDLLLIHVPATNTITFDNSATMLLGAATRAVAPGGSLLLIAVSATVWHEVSFLTAAS
jgi:hypothetical protein